MHKSGKPHHYGQVLLFAEKSSSKFGFQSQTPFVTKATASLCTFRINKAANACRPLPANCGANFRQRFNKNKNNKFTCRFAALRVSRVNIADMSKRKRKCLELAHLHRFSLVTFNNFYRESQTQNSSLYIVQFHDFLNNCGTKYSLLLIYLKNKMYRNI